MKKNINLLNMWRITGKRLKLYLMMVIFIFLNLGLINRALAQEGNDICFMCHDDPTLTSENPNRKGSLYVPPGSLDHSVHKNVLCASCHTDANVEDYPHPADLKPVNCGTCHEQPENDFYEMGFMVTAFQSNDKNAPSCKDCHGTHEILSSADPKSRTYKMNIPVLCGQCHKEGAKVSRNYNINERNILENYSQGIHGRGLFQAGLVVTATCNDCHGNHLILPHTNMNSSISQKNIASTCMKCHARIEDVHVKVINRELWEKKPGAIPACTDCHPPHKVEMQNILTAISDKTCLACHERDDIHKVVDGKNVSLKVDVNDMASSAHKNITCVKCHSDVTANRARPCETAG